MRRRREGRGANEAEKCGVGLGDGGLLGELGKGGVVGVPALVPLLVVRRELARRVVLYRHLAQTIVVEGNLN